MRVLCWSAIGCLVFASSSAAADGENIPAERLPPEVVEHIREGFHAEPLSGRKEVEGGRTCYLVAAVSKGEVIEIYASPDGHALIRKTEAFSSSRWLDRLAAAAIVIVLPGLIVGATARGMVRVGRDRPLSVPEGWLSAWFGIALVMALVFFNVSTGSREKDVPIVCALCVVWPAIPASVVEMVVVALRKKPDTENRSVRRRWVIGLGVVAVLSLVLTIPLDVLRIDRENQVARNRTLRPVSD
jgi:hypothetical protein